MSFSKRFLSLLLALTLTSGYAFASAEAAESPASEGSNTDIEITEDLPVSEEDPAAEEAPAPEETPVLEETPTAEETPAAEETPLSEETAALSEEAVITDTASGNAAGDAASAEPESLPWQTPGNTDSEILNGGLFLYTDDGFYFSDGGIWYRSGTTDSFICAGDAMNLNLADGLLYFTGGSTVYRVSPAGGEPEIVTGFDTDITELYVIGQELRFLAGGCVYSYSMASDTLRQLDAPDDVTGLIPTEYGDLYLTGSAFHRTLWAGTVCAMTDIERCYTDSGMLVIIADGRTLQADPAALLSGDFSTEAYSLHQDMAGGSDLTAEQEADAQAAYFTSDGYLALQDDITVNTDGMYISHNNNIAWTAQASGTLTSGQKNLITRARLMAELSWTAAADLTWWTGTKSGTTTYATDGTASSSSDSSEGVFLAGRTYQGVPYSQPVTNKGYVGWNISLSNFLTAASNASSLLYTTHSGTYAGYYGPYYGIDCSGFVSYAWDLSSRRTVSHLRDSDVSACIGSSIQNLQVGDTLNRDGVHVLLVTDLAYNASGSIVSVEVTEQVPPKVKVTCYGEVIPGRSYEYTGKLSTLAAYMTSYNYSIYRRAVSASISVPDTSAVDLDAAVRDISATGWTQYHNAWYYFNTNGEMVTSSWLQYYGSSYYLGYDGKMLAGTIAKIDGAYYAFDSSGRMTGTASSGWLWHNGYYYYFDSDGTMHTGWLWYSGSYYYLRADGTMIAGDTLVYGGRTYGFGADGAMIKNGWLWHNDNYYYFDSDGTMRTGWLWYSGSYYYLRADGTMIAGDTIDYNGSTYGFNAGGVMITNNWLWKDNAYYFFDSSGCMVKSSWVWWGAFYYMDSTGAMLHGSSTLDLMIQIGDNTYAFDADGVMLANEWVLRNNDYYYFGSDGGMLKKSWLWYNGSFYYFDSNGRMLFLSGTTGTDLVAVYAINGNRYGFNNSGAMRTGWGQTTDGSRYYFGSDGSAYTLQWLWYDDSFYYFGSNSKMLQDQWLEYDGSYYYFDENGKMLTDTTPPDGYQVDSTGRRV